jgi:hypothetical protein
MRSGNDERADAVEDCLDRAGTRYDPVHARIAARRRMREVQGWDHC